MCHHVCDFFRHRFGRSGINRRRRSERVEKTLPWRRHLADSGYRREPWALPRPLVIRAEDMDLPLRQQKIGARGANGGPNVLARLKLPLKPWTGAAHMNLAAADVEKHLVYPVSADAGFDATLVGEMDVEYAAAKVVGVAETDVSARHQPSKTLFGKAGIHEGG